MGELLLDYMSGYKSYGNLIILVSMFSLVCPLPKSLTPQAMELFLFPDLLSFFRKGHRRTPVAEETQHNNGKSSSPVFAAAFLNLSLE